jgi:SAM-dependent methyltransferase
MATDARSVYGLEFDFDRAITARDRLSREASNGPQNDPDGQSQDRRLAVICGAGEALPFPDGAFDLVLSHEVLEHVRDDRRALEEICRVLQPPDPPNDIAGGRAVLFVPNRGYPFETHGVYWRGEYHFGNIPLVNYLPDRWRDRLAPHVRAYRKADLGELLRGLPVRIIEGRIIFGAYDNIIARAPVMGKMLRTILHALEGTPLKIFGLSHFVVVEKTSLGATAKRADG